MFDENYKFTCVDRFLKYVKYDTQSDEESESFPSTEKQKVLSKDLAEELKSLGLEDAHMDENGYVMATLPSNTDKKIPAIAFLAHVDTSPAVSGANVNALIHKDYQGGDIELPKDDQVIKADENPDLKDMIGHDIITSDGSTLLGADNKAGVAEIMDAVEYLLKHPEIKRGPVKICFTPDEETGRGTEKIDVDKLDAKYGYTVDGQSRGELEIETFSADSFSVTFQGKNIHPGYGKNRLVNSIKIASKFIDSLPKDRLSPETTEKREGFVHCVSMTGGEETTTCKFIIRDFETEKLKEYEDMLIDLADKAVEAFPGSKMTYEITEQYRNMRYVLDKHPQVRDYALEALRRMEIEPKLDPIRGGTDGARLSYMGLPTPNIFAGEHAFHSKVEWISIQDMYTAVQFIIEIIKVWEEKGAE